jgi:ABC-type glutathione transport system ATPase component
MDEALLRVEGLGIAYPGPSGAVAVVDGASLELHSGRILGIAGESGSGKTQLLLALLGLVPRAARVTGSIRLRGEQLVGRPDARLQQLRGNRIAIVFQDPMTALNPQLRIGLQLTEVLGWHRNLRGAEARERAAQMLAAVGLAEPARLMVQYPHELSGGMRQRVMIAMALLCEPDLLLADEPTTALDVTVQAQVLALLRDLRDRLGMAILLVTHDLGVIAQVADDVLVMQSGRIVERGEVTQLFAAPRDAYTQRLLAAARRLEIPAERPA